MLHLLLAAATPALLPVKKPIRSLVYAFTFSAAAVKQTGTVRADVMGVTTDGGLIVRFSQDVPGNAQQTFGQQECVVYGDTRVLCQQRSALTPFENELGRLLGRNFVSGDKMDDKNHWRISSNAGGSDSTDDYTVTANNGGLVTITEKRSITIDSGTSEHNAQITYDMNRTVPTAFSYTDGVIGTPGSTVSASYTLQSDSLAAAPPKTP